MQRVAFNPYKSMGISKLKTRFLGYGSFKFRENLAAAGTYYHLLLLVDIRPSVKVFGDYGSSSVSPLMAYGDFGGQLKSPLSNKAHSNF